MKKVVFLMVLSFVFFLAVGTDYSQSQVTQPSTNETPVLDESRSIIRMLTGPGELRWTSGKGYQVAPPKFRLRDGKLEGAVFYSPLSPLQWIPVAYDGKQLQYEFTWYTDSNYPFKTSVKSEIISTSPLRLKAKVVEAQQWGDRSVGEHECELEWVNDR